MNENINSWKNPCKAAWTLVLYKSQLFSLCYYFYSINIYFINFIILFTNKKFYFLMCSSFSLFRPLLFGGKITAFTLWIFWSLASTHSKITSSLLQTWLFLSKWLDQIWLDSKTIYFNDTFQIFCQLAFIKFLESWLEHRKYYMNVFLKQNKIFGHLYTYVFISPSGPKIMPFSFIFIFHCEIVLTYTWCYCVSY